MTLDILPRELRTATRFPRCNLHGRLLVDGFPARCPLRAARPLAAIARMQEAAYADLGDPRGDRGGAALLLARAEICDCCVGTNLGHPHVRRLRLEARP